MSARLKRPKRKHDAELAQEELRPKTKAILKGEKPTNADHAKFLFGNS
jgi:hypothetical protein